MATKFEELVNGMVRLFRRGDGYKCFYGSARNGRAVNV